MNKSIFFAELLRVHETYNRYHSCSIWHIPSKLVVTLSAAKQGFWNITFDNITGSNIANIYLILGFSGLIYPVAVEQISLFFTTPTMILISVILLVFISTGWEIK